MYDFKLHLYLDTNNCITFEYPTETLYYCIWETVSTKDFFLTFFLAV